MLVEAELEVHKKLKENQKAIQSDILNKKTL